MTNWHWDTKSLIPCLESGQFFGATDVLETAVDRVKITLNLRVHFCSAPFPLVVSFSYTSPPHHPEKHTIKSSHASESLLETLTQESLYHKWV